MGLCRRHLIAAALGTIGLAAVPVSARSKRKPPKRTPAPDPALTSVWPADVAPRVIPVLCGAGPDWIGPVRAAVETWNGAQAWLRLEVHEVEAPVEGTAPVLGAIVVTAPWRDADWNGLTDLHTDGLAIVAATVSFDDADYRGLYPWPKSGPREWIAAHELGHALGLPHAPDGDGGCMGRYGDGSLAAPSAWTLAQLALAYAREFPEIPPKRKRRGRGKKQH